MNENDLITLDNGISYAMMKEFNNEETGEKILFGIEFKDGKFNYKNAMFFRAGKDDEGEYLDEIHDPKELDALSVLTLTDVFLDAYPECEEAFEEALKGQIPE